MIVRNGEPQRLDIKSGKYCGVTLTINMVAAATNNELVPSDLVLTNFTMKCYLQRNGTIYPIHTDQLQNIGTYNMRKNAYERFLNGLDTTLAASGVKNVKVRVANIMFGGVVEVRQGDTLTFEYQSNGGFYSSNVDTSVSFVDFLPMPSTGKEFGIPMFKAEVVQTNASSEQHVNADGVADIQFINYDKGDLSSPPLSNISLMSDKLQYTASWVELLGSEQTKYPQNKPYRFTTSLPNTTPQSVVMGLDWLPCSVSIFHPDGALLNQVQVSCAFNTDNVTASNNWVMFTRRFVDPNDAVRAIRQTASAAKADIARFSQGRY